MNAQNSQWRKNPIFFETEGSNTVILMAHGFTGLPGNLINFARMIHAAGFTVDIPCLPGHGYDPEALTRVDWEDWYQCLEERYLHHRMQGKRVIVIGYSAGGNLASLLAARHDGISGLVMLNTPAFLAGVRNAGVIFYLLPFLSRNFPYVPDPDEGKQDWFKDELPLQEISTRAIGQFIELVIRSWWSHRKVKVPTRIFQSQKDEVVAPLSAKLIYWVSGAKRKRLIEIKGAKHPLTLSQQEEAGDAIIKFLRESV